MSILGGGGGAVSTNDQIVAEQNRQASQAAMSSADTNARLQQGVKEITGLFEGVPAGSSILDLSSIANANPYTGALPSSNARPTFQTKEQVQAADPNRALEIAYLGTKAGQSAGADLANLVYNAGQSASYGGKLGNGYTWGVLADTGGGTPMYGIFDPGGNLVTDASSLSDLSKARITIGGDPNAKSGGFGDDFYNTYRNSILGYYLPQEDQQYAKARSSLTYNLSRAGQLNSSVAGMDVADLANQDTINRANIASSADQQTGALRTQVSQNEQTALNQLYSTENPSVAANTAQNLVANAQLTKPLLNPAGQLFNVASVGVGNALSGFTNPYAYINPNAGGIGATTTSGAGSTASGATGTGSNVSA